MDDAAALEERKRKLLSKLDSNGAAASVPSPVQQTASHPPSILSQPVQAHEQSVPAATTTETIYSKMLAHFESNPAELHAFASRIVLDALRAMHQQTASATTTNQQTPNTVDHQLIEEVVKQTAPILAPVSLDEPNSDPMLVDGATEPKEAVEDASESKENGETFGLQLVGHAVEEYSGPSSFLKGVRWFVPPFFGPIIQQKPLERGNRQQYDRILYRKTMLTFICDNFWY